jgi:hypothetical protein
VCNTKLGYCEPNLCCTAKCTAGTTCSPLLGQCVGCLSDCQCLGLGSTCDAVTQQCSGCQAEKFKMTQDNPQMYEFYELCVLKSAGDKTADLKAIDESIYCGVAGNFVGCDKATETGCHGDLDYVGVGNPSITNAKWQQLCQMSMFDFVTKIGGGHFVE